MIRAEITTVVARPVEDVFAYLADFDNIPRHDEWVKSIEKTSPGPVGVGSTWHSSRVQGRRTIEAPIEMVEFEPNRRMVIVSGSEGFEVRATQTFTPKGAESTEVAEVVEMRLSGMIRLFEPIIRRQVPKQTETVHQRFKAILETDGS